MTPFVCTGKPAWLPGSIQFVWPQQKNNKQNNKQISFFTFYCSVFILYSWFFTLHPLLFTLYSSVFTLDSLVLPRRSSLFTFWNSAHNLLRAHSFRIVKTSQSGQGPPKYDFGPVWHEHLICDQHSFCFQIKVAWTWAWTDLADVGWPWRALLTRPKMV